MEILMTLIVLALGIAFACALGAVAGAIFLWVALWYETFGSLIFAVPLLFFAFIARQDHPSDPRWLNLLALALALIAWRWRKTLVSWLRSLSPEDHRAAAATSRCEDWTLGDENRQAEASESVPVPYPFERRSSPAKTGDILAWIESERRRQLN